MTDKAVDALARAFDLDETANRWPTLRGTVHELARRMAESTTAVLRPAAPIAVLELLEEVAMRDPVRGRAALAAYCTHLCQSWLARHNPMAWSVSRRW